MTNPPPAEPTQFPVYAMMVLLVDDQPMIGEAVHRLLEGEPNLELHYCSSVREAIEQANDIKPTVILQDLVMPTIGGLDAVRLFRRNSGTAETPIIVLSSREDPETKSQAFAAGANDYLVKLPDKVELIARIKYHSKSYLNQLQRDEAYRALRESQQQLLDKNTALVSVNQMLEETARALNEAKIEADRANQAKSDFLSRMSHELRTPLHAILGFGQLLEMQDLPPDQKENAAQILKGGRHLLELINEVLDIARIEAGRVSLCPEVVNVGEVLDECLALIRPLALQRAISVEFTLDAAEEFHVCADRQRLKQVMLNLLSNAVKYNRDVGRVIVTCEPAPEQLVSIKVSDTGSGIAPENLGRLFGAFERLGADQNGTEGTGLGLAVSKCLVELMQGRIGVESVPGEGSTFTVTLPRVAPDSQAAAS